MKAPKDAPACIQNPEKKPERPEERISAFVTGLVDGFARIIRRHTRRFSCYDMYFYLLPMSLISKLTDWIFKLANFIIGMYLGTLAAPDAQGAMLVFIQFAAGFIVNYVGNIFYGLAVVLRERRHIHCSNKKLAWYLLTWPLHDWVYPYICIASLFMRVKWKPIKHDAAITIDEIANK